MGKKYICIFVSGSYVCDLGKKLKLLDFIYVVKVNKTLSMNVTLCLTLLYCNILHYRTKRTTYIISKRGHMQYQPIIV